MIFPKADARHMVNIFVLARFFLFVGIILFLVVGFPKKILAGKHDFQIWTPVYLTVNFTDKIQGWYEAQPRFGDDASQVNQLLLRTALGYTFAENWSIWQGYAWTPDIEPKFKTENRIYQQLLYAQKFPAIKMMSRTRLEERWIKDVSGTAVRFRTLLRGQVPLGDQGRWGIVVQDEIFFNINSPTNGPDSGLDQNRVFVGINRAMNEYLNVDAGYQLQTVNTSESGVFNDKNSILLVQFFLTW
jgi:hypothetical protein